MRKYITHLSQICGLWKANGKYFKKQCVKYASRTITKVIPVISLDHLTEKVSYLVTDLQ